MTMLKPQDIMIGDWLLAGDKVIQVAAVHLKKVGYHERHDRLTWVRLDRLKYIIITPVTLIAFGFKKIEPDGWLFNEAWEFRAENLTYNEGNLFKVSWKKEFDNERSYRITCRGYAEFAFFHHDAISDLQHFFYEYTRNVMPIKYVQP